MGSGSPTLKMVTHTRTLLLLLLGVTGTTTRQISRQGQWTMKSNGEQKSLRQGRKMETFVGTDLHTALAIARALKKNKKKELINVLFDEPEVELRLRSGIFAKSAEETFDDEFENVCGSVWRTIAPKVGTNTNNQQRYLVQGDIDLAEFSGLVRTVQTVECLGSQLPGERESCGILPGRRTECRQEYTEHRMVALDMEKGELVVEAFNFPSCCSCMVHRGFDL